MCSFCAKEKSPTLSEVQQCLEFCVLLIVCLDISNDNLISCHKNITAVGGTKLHCEGWVPLKFTIGQHNTIQPVFICDKVSRIYFSRKGCQETNILPPSFPYPMPNNTVTSATVEANHIDKQTTLPISRKTCENTTMSPTTTTLPTRPTQLPYPPKPENIEKLKEFIVQKFSSSAFNTENILPVMDTQPAHKHLKKDAIPHACHTPIPILHHWKKEVKKSIDADVQRGIIEPVPIGEPVEWCAQMVVIPKKDGRPRRTVDLQKLNAQCS